MHRRPTPKQYPSDFIGGKPVLSTGYLVSCSRTQRSASGEARTRNPSISGQALYHDCAPQQGSILCRYDTCPTQYAPDLRGSILCMQGTQYAPRESILCMEHFVAIQRIQIPLKVDHHRTVSETPLTWRCAGPTLNACLVFQRFWTRIAKKPYICVIFQGGPDPLPPPPLWIRP